MTSPFQRHWVAFHVQNEQFESRSFFVDTHNTFGFDGSEDANNMSNALQKRILREFLGVSVDCLAELLAIVYQEPPDTTPNGRLSCAWTDRHPTVGRFPALTLSAMVATIVIF